MVCTAVVVWHVMMCILTLGNRRRMDLYGQMFAFKTRPNNTYHSCTANISKRHTHGSTVQIAVRLLTTLRYMGHIVQLVCASLSCYPGFTVKYDGDGKSTHKASSVCAVSVRSIA